MNGCTVGTTGGGGLARAGRAMLRADLTARIEPSVPGACDCARCCPPQLTDIEAQRALRHVTDDSAVAYGRGEVTVVSLRGCGGDECDGWVPMFTEVT